MVRLIKPRTVFGLCIVWDGNNIYSPGLWSGKLGIPIARHCLVHLLSTCGTRCDPRQLCRLGQTPVVQFLQWAHACSPCLETGRSPGQGGGARWTNSLLIPRVEFVKLSKEYDTVNLGQGFPNFPPPDFAVEAFQQATSGDFMLNQYTMAFVSPLASPGGLGSRGG